MIKQRVARPGQGKSGGYRTIILYRQAHRAFFVYGFAKSQQSNISDEEKVAFKRAAQHILELSEQHLVELIHKGHFWRWKTMAKKYRSEAMAAIHETMEALHEVGAVDKQTMRDFDESCLTTVEMISPDAIRALRERENLSQSVFARYLNVSKNLVSDWERGVKRPGGPALRLLAVIQKKGIQAIAC